jgi:EmrB/QacA subfamily drug resistance transporter
MANLVKSPCDEGAIRSAPSGIPCSQNVKAWVLVATILGSSLATIDSSVVNVALPVLQERLNATVAQVQWVVEAYALFLAALILVGGSLGDRYGRRRIYAIGIVVFAIASLICGLSPNVQLLIYARALQGVGGALLVPGSLAIISASFAPEQRGRAIGTWSGFTAISAAVGPILGGWLVEQASWRWIFYINLPIAAILLGLVFWRVPESRDSSVRGKLDWWGAMLVTLGLGGIVYGLIESSHLGFNNPRVWIALIVGIIAAIAFVVVEARIRSPMMPLELFGSKTFSGANLLTLLLYAALGGVLFFLPFNLIQVQGYSATAAGAAFLPLILLMFVLSRWAGGLVDRYGAKRPLVIGPAIAAVGFALLAVPSIGGSYWTTFFPAVVVLGLGMAISVAPLTTTVMGSVGVERSGVASGINNAVARTAGLLAIAVFGIIVAIAFAQTLNARLTALEIPAHLRSLILAERSKLAGATIPPGVDAATASLLKHAILESFIVGFRSIMALAAGLAFFSAISAAYSIDSTQTQTKQQKTQAPSRLR